MKLTGIGRLGRDGETRYIPTSGEAVLNLAIAYNFGKKDEDGNRQTQWVDAALFGKRAESLGPYLIKGTQAYFEISGVHIETYQKKDGTTGTKLTGTVSDIELVGSRKEANEAQPNQSSTPSANTRTTQQAQVPDNFAEFDDDMIPF